MKKITFSRLRLFKNRFHSFGFLVQLLFSLLFKLVKFATDHRRRFRLKFGNITYRSTHFAKITISFTRARTEISVNTRRFLHFNLNVNFEANLT